MASDADYSPLPFDDKDRQRRLVTSSSPTPSCTDGPLASNSDSDDQKLSPSDGPSLSPFLTAALAPDRFSHLALLFSLLIGLVCIVLAGTIRAHAFDGRNERVVKEVAREAGTTTVRVTSYVVASSALGRRQANEASASSTSSPNSASITTKLPQRTSSTPPTISIPTLPPATQTSHFLAPPPPPLIASPSATDTFDYSSDHFNASAPAPLRPVSGDSTAMTVTDFGGGAAVVTPPRTAPVGAIPITETITAPPARVTMTSVVLITLPPGATSTPLPLGPGNTPPAATEPLETQPAAAGAATVQASAPMDPEQTPWQTPRPMTFVQNGSIIVSSVPATVLTIAAPTSAATTTVVLASPAVSLTPWGYKDNAARARACDAALALLGPRDRELASLALNALVTIVTELTGRVHAATLRTTLAAKDRLEFNASLRLFQTGGTWRSPNGALANAGYAISLVLAYTSASLVFAYLDRATVLVSWAPVFVLGCCITVQATLAMTALRFTKSVIWTTSPLEMAAACEYKGYITRRPGKCLIGIEGRNIEASDGVIVAAAPKSRQISAWSAHQDVRKVILGVSVVAITGFIWFLSSVLYLRLRYGQRPSNWSPFVTAQGLDNPTSFIGVYFVSGDNFSPSNLFWDLLIVGVAQALLTVSLHACELIVTLSRDESTWRQATTRGGAKAGESAFKRVWSSWQAVPLLVAKTVCHWCFGLAISLAETTDVSNIGSLQMRPVQIMYLTLVFGILAAFVTFLAVWRLRGPQPAVFGHLAALVDLIDEWPRENRMYWGRKHGGEAVAGYLHAGTSGRRLPPVVVGRGLYA